MAHKLFIAFLVLLGFTAVLSIGAANWDFYSASPRERMMMKDSKPLRSSGAVGHGFGIVGTTMIIVGIGMYSTRKRVRALWNAGKLSTWLEIHMFLCLVGPTLVVYHTTFKAGGIAAISLWSMLSVMASGIVGRFLYVLIPRNVKGAELSSQQINEEFDAQRALLAKTEIGERLLKKIDASFITMKRPENLGQTVSAYLQMAKMKRSVHHIVQQMIADAHISHHEAREVKRVANSRASLIQRSLLLLQVEKLFYYWHVIHLPFTFIMFLTLAAHVGVALWLGYTWIL